MATTMRFIIVTDDRGSKAVDRFTRSLEKSGKAAERQQSALNAQQKQADRTSASLTGLVGHVTGLGDVSTVASRKASMLLRVLAGINIATGIAEPALAGLLVTVGGLAAAYSAAAAGAGAYMVALKPLMTETSAAVEAQKKLEDARAKAQQAYTAALKSGTGQEAAALARTQAMTKAQQDYALAMKGIPAPVRRFSQEIKNVQETYKGWANSLARPVLAPLSKGLKLVSPILHALSPLVLAAAHAIGILVDQLGKAINTGGLERVVQGLLPHVEPAILALGRSIGNITAGIGGIIRAFLPMADQVGRGVEGLTAKFRAWAESLPSHTGFQSLMTMFREQAPLATQVLKNLAEIIKNVAAATIGLATPANSKALLQILNPLSQIMVRLTANQGLVRTVLYIMLLRGALSKLGLAFGGVKAGISSFLSLGGVTARLAPVVGRFAGGFTSAAVAASAFSGVAGTLGGKLATLVGRGTKTYGVLASLGTALAGLAGWAPAIIAGAGALADLADKVSQQTEPLDRLSDKLKEQYNATGWNVKGWENLAGALATNAQRNDLVTSTVTRLGIAYGGNVRNHLATIAETTQKVNDTQREAATVALNLGGRLNTLGAAYGLTQQQAALLASKAGVTWKQLAATGREGEAAYGKITRYAAGEGQAVLQSMLLTASQRQLAGALSNVQNKLLAGQSSLVAWRQAQNSATQAINASTTGLKGNSAAALNAKAAVVQATQAAINHANAQAKTRDGVRKASDTIRDQIHWLEVHGGKSKWATDQINALRDALAKLKSKQIKIQVDAHGTYAVVAGGHRLLGPPGASATGGQVRGPGGPTEDRAGLYALSNREWVIRANSATRYGDKAMDAVNRGQATIWYPGMAAGGRPPARPAAAQPPGLATGGKAITGSYTGTPKGTGSFMVRKYDETVKVVQDAAAKEAAKALAGVWGAGAGKKLVNYLRPYVGRVPYRWGGASPAGWDCSGMVVYGLKNALGISAPRTSQSQWGWVRRTRDQVGALAFFVGAYPPPPGHVGVSLGNGAMINAAGTAVGTVVSGTGGAMGFGIPPGKMAKGGKVKTDPRRKQYLAMLAQAVRQLRNVEKRAASFRKSRRHALDVEELWLLRHPRPWVSRGDQQEGAHRTAHIAALRKGLAAFNRRIARRESTLSREINILRRLTGFPRGKKYGGPGKPAPVDDGTGDLGDGGGDYGGGGDVGAGGGGTTSSGPPPIPPPPMPSWMVAAGLGGGSAGVAASAGAGQAVARYGWPGWRMGRPWRTPFTDPLSAWRGAGYGGGGGGWGHGPDGFAELAMALRMMSREVTGAVNRVAPGVATGMDRSLNSMTGRVSGKMP